MARRSTYRVILCSAGLLALAAAGPAAAEAAEAPQLGMPLDCVPGETCWIVNYVDHDPTTGLRDYMCGKATYNEPGGKPHKGTDIAVRDLAAMRSGVAVLAAAPSVVARLRDGVPDLDFHALGEARELLKGRECGNAVVTGHKGGWEVQYCHMQKGSIVVKRGDRVKAGQPLGLVGLSGMTNFPHLHIQVSKGKTIVDPFAGPNPDPKCSISPQPLWKPDILAKFPYPSTAIFNAGFAAAPPKSDLLHEGLYQAQSLSALAPALFLWVGIYRLKAGDNLTFSITGPDKKKILNDTRKVTRDQARRLEHRGIRRKSGAWPKGARDGMLDVNILHIGGPEAVKGTECGNGLRIDHGGGWTTQYCHLLRGSVAVKKGRIVEAGQLLGFVGLSGFTGYPHVHFQVEHNRKVVDPFAGLNRGKKCGIGPHPLWKKDALTKLPYQPTTIYNAGFAGGPIDAERVRAGAHNATVLPASAPAIVLWVDIFHSRQGDVVRLAVIGPTGETILNNSTKFRKNLARALRSAARKRMGSALPRGTYRGEITLVRKATNPGGPLKIAVTRQVTVEY